MPDIEEFMDAVPAGIRTIGLPYGEVPECSATWDELIRACEPVTDYEVPAPYLPLAHVFERTAVAIRLATE